MITHDLGRIFCGMTNANIPKVTGIDKVYLNEYPYHKCEHALFFHVWYRKALVIGIWKPRKVSVNEHLLEALKGREVVSAEEKAVILPGLS